MAPAGGALPAAPAGHGPRNFRTRAVERSAMPSLILSTRGLRSSVMPRAFASFSLVALALVACAPAAPSPLPVAPIPSSASSDAATVSPARALQAPNVEALKAALAADGYRVRISASKDGRVAIVNFVQKAPTTKLPHEIFLAVMKAHGDSLGYGPLGEAELGGSAGLVGAIGAMVGRFPNAQACPNLHYEAAFEELDAATRTPLMWGFGCDKSEQEMKYFSSFQGTVRRLNEARQPHVPEVTDPFATWLRSESIQIDKVERSADGVRATPYSAPALAGDRLALVKAFAERAARSEGLPALDTVDLQPHGNSPTSPALLPKTFGTLTLRQAKPPLDGPCIDPRVVVNVFDAVVDPPSVRIVGVAVECAKEPATGSKAPPDASRPLPRAAVASLPFIAICDSINFAWGYQHSGRVIDKRGDVYTFSGGRYFSGKSAQELAVLLRHGKHYEGTLPPAEVDRLVSLAAQVEREPFQKHAVQIYDAPDGGCRLFRSGPTADALVPIPFDEFGTTVGKRVGPASSEAETVLNWAQSLAAPR